MEILGSTVVISGGVPVFIPQFRMLLCMFSPDLRFLVFLYIVGENKSGSGKGKVSLLKTYISPWERALGLTPQEKSEFSIDLLSYGTKADLCHYKSFNR